MAELPQQNTPSLPPCPKPALGGQGEHQMLGWLQTSLLLLPTVNCITAFWKQRFTLQFSEFYFFFLLLVIKKLQLQQAAVSPHQLAVCPPPRDKHTTADVTCSTLCAAEQDRDPLLQAPTVQHGSAHVSWPVSHGCSAINAQSSLASHPSFAAVPSTLAHELPLKVAPTHTLLSFLGSALALNALPLLKSYAAHEAWQRTSMV